LGCGANFAKQLIAINNTGYKFATVHISIVNFSFFNFAVANLSIVNFAVVDFSVVDISFIRPVNDSRHQLDDHTNHDDPNHTDLK
jgi:hypothetical protein